MQTPHHAGHDSSPLLERVLARRDELARRIAQAPKGEAGLDAIEAALATLDVMLQGDPTKTSDMLSHELATWLEANKYLGIHAATAGFRLPPTRH